MKRNLLLIAIAALILPAIARGLWFYRGVPETSVFATPDFSALSAPQAPLKSAEKPMDDPVQYEGVALFDAAHANQFSLAEVEALTGAVKARGGQVELLTDYALLEHKLKYASAFVTISPMLSFNAEEIRAIERFVERGGRLLVFTEPTRNSIYFDFVSGNPIAYSDASAANSLLASFGITVNDDYLYNLERNEGNFRNVFFDEFGKSEVTFGLKEVALYGTHSLESPSGLVLLRGAESTLSSANDAHDPAQGGAALSADGNVLAFGDLTFLTSPYNNYADNAVLIDNLAEFALSGSRTVTLDNFPFVFKGKTVRLYLSSELIRSTEAFAALGRMQAALRNMKLQVEFVEELPRDGDAIIVSTFAPGEEMEPLIKKFGLEFEAGSEFVTMPGFGRVGIYGNNILLFDATPNGNRLVLFGNKIEDAVYLIDTLNLGYLSFCLSQENIAVCSTGYGSPYQTESSPTPVPEMENTEETPTPEAQG